MSRIVHQLISASPSRLPWDVRSDERFAIPTLVLRPDYHAGKCSDNTPEGYRLIIGCRRTRISSLNIAKARSRKIDDARRAADAGRREKVADKTVDTLR